jgi:hypothetical protein
MPRKSSAAALKEPPSLPDVAIPLSEVPEHQRAAYELELIDNPEEFRKVVSTEDFFPMIQGFPAAWWGERLSMYLYRHEDDGGLMVKNAEGEGKYIKPVIRRAIDRDYVANIAGGGKYQLWLNLSDPETRRSVTIRKYTFRIDGAPLVKPGQVIEVDGKPVSVGAAPAVAPEHSDIAKVIDANAHANASSMKMLENAASASIEMVKEQAKSATTAAPSQLDLLTTATKLIELLKPAAPSVDPVQQELMKAIIARAFREPEEARDAPQTPISETLATVRELKEVLPELVGKATKAAADPAPWIAPLVQIGQTLVTQIPAIMQQARINRDLEFQRMVFLRNSKPGEAPPQNLLPSAPAPAPAPAAAPAHASASPPSAADPQAVVQGLITMIADGFDKDPRAGYETAAAIAYHYGDAIESLGFDKTLGNPKEVDKFVAGLPPLAHRAQDARWEMYRHDFLEYTIDRWGDLDGGVGAEADDSEQDIAAGPQPVA